MGFNISRYQKQIQREFEVEVVTPMFLAHLYREGKTAKFNNV